MSEQLVTCHLGVVEYRAAYALQERLRAARQDEAIDDTLLLLEHPRTYTRTRRSGAADLPRGERWYRDQGIEIVDVDRGGNVTYHGPGQLVGYPIMRTGDVVAFIRTMERALVGALGDIGLAARSRADEGADYTGVWVQDRKIASIGVHVQRGVTTHGFAINVSNDLDPFTWVVACGLPTVTMTSVAAELGGGGVDDAALRDAVAQRFAAAHGRSVGAVELEELDPAARPERSLR